VYDDYLERVVGRASTRLKVGAGTEPDVKVGPLIDPAALEKVERHVADAVDAVPELHLGG
jgi:succinate-semialdehyde dehydrogenase/glutarate-semialdehyde dehydrogenase